MGWGCFIGWCCIPEKRAIMDGQVTKQSEAAQAGRRESMNGLLRLTSFLALKRNTSLLLVMLLLAGTGEKLWLGFAPKYLETLGATVLIIGSFDALQTLLGALYAYPG